MASSFSRSAAFVNFPVTDATHAASSARDTGGCCTYSICSCAGCAAGRFFLLAAERPLERARVGIVSWGK
jgi:hypothetical protein